MTLANAPQDQQRIFQQFERASTGHGIPGLGLGLFISQQIVAAHPGGRVVVFSHAGTINAYCGHVLGQGAPLFFAPDYGSLTRGGAARDGRRGILSLNETLHVRDLLGPRAA